MQKTLSISGTTLENDLKMINHAHKFIFIHCNRTGGTSVEYFFTKETETAHKHWFPLQWKEGFSRGMENLF